MADLIEVADGWSYYTDGTAIGPNGAYYSQGQQVWAPQASGSESAVNVPGVDWTQVLTTGVPRAIDAIAGVVKAQNTMPAVWGQRNPYAIGLNGYGNAAAQQAAGGGGLIWLLIIGAIVMVARG